MIELLIGKQQFAVPGKLDECNTSQLARYASEFIFNRDVLFAEEKDGKIVVKNRLLYEVAMLRLLHVTIGCDWELFTKISNEWKHHLLYEEKLVNFYFTDKFTQAPKIKSKGLIGPSNQFQIGLEEFSFADTFYMLYHQNQSMKALDSFCAVLMRPKKLFAWLAQPSTDLRKKFDKVSVDARIEIVEQIDITYKHALWFWYHKYRMGLPDQYPFVFSGGGQSKKNAGAAWLDVILSAAENGTFGNYSEACRTQHHLIFADMNRRIENSKPRKNA